MRLELEDSFEKRAWVAMAWDARTRKSCWDFVERDDFDEPTFYLTSPGVYCVSGENPAEDRCRWLEIKDGNGEWRDYAEIVHLLSRKADSRSLWESRDPSLR